MELCVDPLGSRERSSSTVASELERAAKKVKNREVTRVESDDQEKKETRSKASFRDMLMSNIETEEGRVSNLEEFSVGMKETLKVVKGRTVEYRRVLEAMMIVMTEKTEAMMTALKEQFEELMGELVVCKVVLGKEVLSATPNHKTDVSKPEKFKGTKSTRYIDNFL
ncbi:hypothetical protein J1N35_045060 [Gossypium stocksii]|uniref:Uncharacterized protein n=1 Tax=Gossypium stocksii TaxID=47602 RepID=A0A9D3ZGM9_9ROSI|nr:hypothetical protein J1N35_045060 [Gossypium stocksii]